MPQQPKYLSTDPNAGLSEGASSTAPKYLSTDPHAGTPAAPERSWLDAAGDYLGEALASVNPKNINAAVQAFNPATRTAGPLTADTFNPFTGGPGKWTPIDTVQRIGRAQGDLAMKAEAAFKRGDYAEGVRHAIDYLVPVAGVRLDQAGDLMQKGEYAKGLGATTDLGLQIVGPKVARSVARAVPVEDVANALAERWADSGLKVKESLAERNPGVNIPLETARAGAVASRRGLRDLNTRIKGLSAEVTDAIDASNASVSPMAASQPARALLAERTRLQQVAPQDPAIINQTVQDFFGTGRRIPIRTAQDMKELLGDKLANRFGAEVVPASAEAQDALRAGLRSEIERAVPAVIEPNAEMSRLIPVRDAVKDAVNRSRRWDVGQAAKLGSGSALGGFVGLSTGHPELGALGGAVLARLLENPAVKTRIASGIYQAGQAAPAVGAGLDAVGPTLLRAALLQQMGNEADGAPSR